jgi:DNA-binding response OmpR family regulator
MTTKSINAPLANVTGTCKGNILIAEDDPDMRYILEVIFSEAGYSLDIKDNGSDLLRNDFEVPDLFIIDRQLPGYSGTDICQHLKKQSHTQNIPVIMISGSREIARLSRQAGADSYIEKPFEVSYILKIVNYYIHVKHMHRSAIQEG